MHRFFTFLFSWARAPEHVCVFLCDFVLFLFFFISVFLPLFLFYLFIRFFVRLFVCSFAWIKQLDDIAVQDVWNGRHEQNKSDFFFSYLCFCMSFRGVCHLIQHYVHVYFLSRLQSDCANGSNEFTHTHAKWYIKWICSGNFFGLLVCLLEPLRN